MEKEHEVSVKDFVYSFFEKLQCSLSYEGNILIVEKVPKSFEEHLGQKAPYRLTFESFSADALLVERNSPFFTSILSFLDSSSKDVSFVN